MKNHPIKLIASILAFVEAVFLLFFPPIYKTASTMQVNKRLAFVALAFLILSFAFSVSSIFTSKAKDKYIPIATHAISLATLFMFSATILIDINRFGYIISPSIWICFVINSISFVLILLSDKALSCIEAIRLNHMIKTLQNYKELLDFDAITNEEYLAKRSELLKRLRD